MRSFSEMSKDKQFSEDYYPYSEQGIKLATQFYLNLERSILFLIINITTNKITNGHKRRSPLRIRKLVNGKCFQKYF